jgi:hypothetical protein
LGINVSVIDENHVREMSLEKRFEFCEPIIKKEQDKN